MKSDKLSSAEKTIHKQKSLKTRWTKDENLIYKDDFKRGIGCPKLMWLMRYRELAAVQNWAQENLIFLNNKERDDFATIYGADTIAERMKVESMIESHLVSGLWFEQLIAEHFAKKYKFFTFPKRKVDMRFDLEATKKILNDQYWEVFWHPYFKSGSFVTEIDFLMRNGDGFDLYEVKSVSNISAKQINNDLRSDLAYQYRIMKECGLLVKNVYIIYINNDYVRDGEVDIEQLMQVNSGFNNEKTFDFNGIEEIQRKVKNWIKRPFDQQMKRFLLSSECDEPDSDGKCTHISPRINSKYDWTQLYRFSRKKKAKLFHDAVNPEIDLDLEQINFSDLNLSDKNLRQIKVIQKIEPKMLNSRVLKSLLESYTYPIYFFDFETTQFAIPRFDKSSPWNQIPFQYSIYVLRSPDFDIKTKKNIDHFEFIATNHEDPRSNFLKNFLIHINKHGKGTYVAYNTPFERMILKLLKPFLTNENDAKLLDYIINNSSDLMDFFKDFNIYYPEFMGSLSLKKTLPALVPDLNYDQLTVKKGNEASNLYFSYMHQQLKDEEWKKLVEDLKEYCGLDTWGLVRIFVKLQELLKNKPFKEIL